MAKKELNLLQFAAGSAAEPGAGSTEIARREFGDADLFGELLDDVPDELFYHSFAPNSTTLPATGATDATENLPRFNGRGLCPWGKIGRSGQSEATPMTEDRDGRSGQSEATPMKIHIPGRSRVSPVGNSGGSGLVSSPSGLAGRPRQPGMNREASVSPFGHRSRAAAWISAAAAEGRYGDESL